MSNGSKAKPLEPWNSIRNELLKAMKETGLPVRSAGGSADPNEKWLFRFLCKKEHIDALDEALTMELERSAQELSELVPNGIEFRLGYIE